MNYLPVTGYEGRYTVSDTGEVHSLNYRRTGLVRELKIMHDSNGYPRVELRKDGYRKTLSLHRLVAIAFIPNPDNKPQVNHKDGNPKNCHVENLEWVTASENLIHSYRELNRVKIWLGKVSPNNKPIYSIDQNGRREDYISLMEASRVLKCCHKSIWDVLKGRQKKYRNMIWRYQ